jgi:PAS domain S-box-containing protein
MDPLLPQLVTTLGAAVMLALVHAYLLQMQATRALALWTVAWGVYALRFVAACFLVASPESGVALWWNQAASVASGLLLLWGALLHIENGRVVPWWWIVCAALLLVWLTVSIPLDVDRPVIFAPVFAFLAAANFFIAAAYGRTTSFSRTGRLFVAAVFVLWGLHKLDYPLLRTIPEAAAWGYVVATLFTVAAGTGLLTVYLEQTRESARWHRRRFEGLVESMNDIVFTLDHEGRFSGVYGRWAQRFPTDAEPLIGRRVGEVFGPAGGRLHADMAAAAFAEDYPVSYEWSHTDEGGHTRYFHTTLSPVRLENNPARELVGLGRDITEMKTTQLELERSVSEKATLLKEVHHRVKNNLQIIVSLIRLQSQDVDDPDTRGALEDTMARVASMAEVHERLYESDDLSSIPFSKYLDDLSSRIIDMHTHPAARPRIDVDGDSDRLDVAVAIPLGLIATELVSNAAKHAVSGRPGERVEVSFRTTESELLLSVRDNGPGLPAGFTPKTTHSLGMALVASLCDQLHAELEWQNGDGAIFRVRVPTA